MTKFENAVYNCDGKELLHQMIVKGIKADWLITDPPYGIKAGGVGSKNYAKQKPRNGVARREYDAVEWDNERIDKEFFDLMFKASHNQIIFGGNYYTDYLPPSKSWIIWDKRCKGGNQDFHNGFADCEIAWCSGGQARVFHYLFSGMVQGDMKNKDERFHPTQKPTQLWTKLLKFYTKENELILDPFMGSFTTAVTCHRLNRRYIGSELDKKYFDKGAARLKKEKNQISLFDMPSNSDEHIDQLFMKI